MSNLTKTIDSSEGEIGFFKKTRATMCKHCPICSRARQSPGSLIGKIMHHPFHTRHCPMWKAYEDVYGEHRPND